MEIVTLVIVIAGVIVAVGTLAINARQLALQTKALSLQTDALVEDRFERMRQREQLRSTLFAALRAELREILSAAEADYVEYRGEQPKSDRIQREGSSLVNEGEIRHHLGFPWSPLPDDNITQAISEAALLGLTSKQIEELQALQGRIRRVDTLVRYKVGLYPALMQADVPKDLTVAQIYGTRPWVVGRADHLNNALSATVYSITGDCKAILGSWRFE
jgi:hypothetical protein